MRHKAKTLSLPLSLGLLLLAAASGCSEEQKDLPPVQEKGGAATQAPGGPVGAQNAPPRTPARKPSEK